MYDESSQGEASARTYQQIGEFVVGFQWLENRLREIGWFIIDPERKDWPPPDLRKEPLAKLIDKVEILFLEVLPKCELPRELETSLRDEFIAHCEEFHELRRARNRILHSAYIELKAGREVVGTLRSDPKLERDPETDEPLFDQEILGPDSFEQEFRVMGRLAMFFNRCYVQLIRRLPTSHCDSSG